MWGSLRQRWFAQREAAALRRRAIADDLWKRTLVRFPFLQRKDPTDAAELRRLTSLFLDRKEFSVTGGLRLTDSMAVAIAAQAVLPILRLGLARYDGFLGIVVHPDQVLVRREETDDDGIVHEFDEALVGEAMLGGPVMLSWRDVRSAGAHDGPAYNVVIHEFAHLLDMANGAIDGVPHLPADIPDQAWRQTLHEAQVRFSAAVEAGAHSILDPYGAETPAEFFAVASEAFFVSPAALAQENPALYALFARYYRQDPQSQTPSRRER